MNQINSYRNFFWIWLDGEAINKITATNTPTPHPTRAPNFVNTANTSAKMPIENAGTKTFIPIASNREVKSSRGREQHNGRADYRCKLRS